MSGWHQPWKYYDNLTVLNVSAEAMPCVDSLLADNSTIYTYLRITGDQAGVAVPSVPSAFCLFACLKVVDGKAYRGNCEDGYTWRSPACRSFCWGLQSLWCQEQPRALRDLHHRG